jgi:hypothetical protein
MRVDFATMISIGQTERTFHISLTDTFKHTTYLSLLSSFIYGNKRNEYRI